MKTQSNAATAAPPRARPKILCVDDEPQVLEALKLVLGRRFEIHTAGDGSAGLRTLEDTFFPVVICDMRMPGMSGSQFFSLVALRWPTTVGILLSGARAFAEPTADAETDVAFRFLTKPCPPHVLRETVAAAFERHETLVRNSTAPLT
jgi:DNA-binding NtrC family response regulator